MTVKRNFEKLYENPDPWNIKDADSERYNFYKHIVNVTSVGKSNYLDIGCGTGVFTSKFCELFDNVYGIDVSMNAISLAKKKWKNINFFNANAGNLFKLIDLNNITFDYIFCSDVIYYLSNSERDSLMRWIHLHLSESGVVFFAGWCPGGRYLTSAELRKLCESYFGIRYAQDLSTKHSIFVLEKKQEYILLTYDYETWQPVPENRVINFTDDILNPTHKILNIFNKFQIKLTFFIEVAEILWLKMNNPYIYKKISEQIKILHKNGHDIQLHIHIGWLPELSPLIIDGKWIGDSKLLNMMNYEGDLNHLVARCKKELIDIVGDSTNSYKPIAFRAGAYSAQPFENLFNALNQNEIIFDSSVYFGGISSERGYNYKIAHHFNNPWYTDSTDPQIEAKNISENSIIELPVAVSNNMRLMLDGQLARNVINQLSFLRFNNSLGSIRFIDKIRFFFKTYKYRRNNEISFGTKISSTKNSYFTLIGHTKSDINENYLNNIIEYCFKNSIIFGTFSSLNEIIKNDLNRTSLIKKGISDFGKKN
jgi:SAM-dependent methyltransferase